MVLRRQKLEYRAHQGEGARVKKKKLDFQLIPWKGTRNRGASTEPKGYACENVLKPL